MIASIKRWFAPPVFEGDEEKTLRASLLNAGAIIMLVFPGLVIIGNLIGGKTPTSTLIIDFISLVFGLLLRSWLHHGKVKFVGAGMMIFVFIITTGSIITLGTIRTPTTTVYLLLVVMAGILFEMRGILISTIASSTAVLGLILAERAGMLPQADYTVTITQWITYTGLFGVIGSLFTFALQTVRKALTRAEKEIVERKRVEMELRKLTRAVEQSPASIVITDLNGSIEYVNPRFTQVTGYSFEEAMGRNPRMLKTALTAPGIHRQLWETLTSGNEWHGEFVNRKKDGSIYFESAIISPIADLHGGTTHYLAVKEDITERKRAEEKLRQQNEYFSILHQITLDLLNRRDMNELLQAIVDRAVILLDAPFGELMLEKNGELIVQTFTHNQKFLKGDRVSRADAKLSWLAFDTKMPAVLDDYSTYAHRRDIYAKDALYAIAELPVLVRDKCIGILAVGRSKPGYVFSDTQINNGMLFAQLVALVLDSAQLYSAAEYEIHERRQAEQALQKANEQLRINLNEIEKLQDELREQAMRDPLTGLYNRRYLNETIEREIIRASRENNQLSVIVSDIDHFKAINDTCGHQIGDQFLMEVANLMKSHARGSDIVCRYGGEEFLLVLPGTTMELAAKRAEEIRQKCAQVTIQYEGNELSITLSFGVSTYPAHGHKPEEIIIKADKALYQSKHNGRNCVTVWNETSS